MSVLEIKTLECDLYGKHLDEDGTDMGGRERGEGRSNDDKKTVDGLENVLGQGGEDSIDDTFSSMER